ncbi:helix-turn-helix domain-containing protein [Chloroflexota bacterium]
MVQEPTISISEASHILGVSEVTLRQWTDEGKIKAFITPGGHRRYSRTELKRFVSPHPKTLGIKDLVTELEDSAPILREVARTFLLSRSWYNELGNESQEYLASLGRHLLNLIIKRVTEPSKQEETLKAIRDVGFSFGETMAKLGLPLTDSVQTFTQHRDPIMNVTTSLMKRREGFNHRIVEAIPLVDHAMDEALISLVTAHQQHRNSYHPQKGGTS